MKTYIFTREVTTEQTWSVDAESEEEALTLLENQDGGECLHEEEQVFADFEFQYIEGEV